MNSITNFTFSITMIFVGMGGTLLVLWMITLMVGILKKIFPAEKKFKNGVSNG